MRASLVNHNATEIAVTCARLNAQTGFNCNNNKVTDLSVDRSLFYWFELRIFVQIEREIHLL